MRASDLSGNSPPSGTPDYSITLEDCTLQATPEKPPDQPPSGPTSETSKPDGPPASTPTVATQSGVAEQAGKSPPTLGFTTYKNERFGFTIDYPQYFVSQPTELDGVALTSPDGRAQLIVTAHNNHGMTLKDYIRLESAVSGRVLYQEAGKDWFVVVRRDGDNRRYLKMFVGNGSVDSCALTFPESWRPEYDAVVDKMERSFTPGDTSRAW